MLALPVLPNQPAGETWLVVAAETGIWIADRGSQSMHKISSEQVVAPHDLALGLSPRATHLAFLTAEAGLQKATLHVVGLPDGETLLAMPLTSGETEPEPGVQQGDPRLEIVRAFTEVDSLAWSPDGTRLAFIGAHQGDSADLYLWDLETREVLRLTDGPNQAIKPLWSPDGAYILHARVTGLGTGAGYGMTGVWAAPANGSPARLLYDPADSGDEIWLGWAAPNNALVYSSSTVCGFENLRAIRLSDGETHVLWAGSFEQAAYDPNSQRILLAVPDLPPICNPPGSQGLWLTYPHAQDGMQLTGEQATQIDWSSAAGKFFALTPGEVLAITASGEVEMLSKSGIGLPLYAPGGRDFAWVATGEQPGIWLVQDGQPARQIFNTSVELIGWSPDGSALNFIGLEGVYQADLSGKVVLIAPIPRVFSAAILSP